MHEPPLSSRGTSTNPPNRFERLAVEPDEPNVGDVSHRLLPRRQPQRPGGERQPGHRLPLQPEPLPRLRARLRLLLRATQPRVSRLQRRARLRAPHHGEGRRARAPARDARARRAGSRRSWRSPATPTATSRSSGKLGITRRCLEVFAEFRNPVGVITKSALVARDADLLGGARAPRRGAGAAARSRRSTPSWRGAWSRARRGRERRLEAIATLAAAGVPVGVMVAPVIPGLNDAEIPRILAAAARGGRAQRGLGAAPPPEAGRRAVRRAGSTSTSPIAGRASCTASGRRAPAASATRDFGRRMRGQGAYAEQIAALFEAAARKHGLDGPLPPLSAAASGGRSARGRSAAASR